MKKEIFSIRKIKKYAGSVLIGSAFFGMGTTVNAAGTTQYHYLDYASLSDEEKQLIQYEVPPQEEEVYYLVYKKTMGVLPHTGTQTNPASFVLGGLALAASSIILVVSKKKKNKILGAILFTTAGMATFIPSTAFAMDLSKAIHEPTQEGIIQIDGYEYVGYVETKKQLQPTTPSETSTANTTETIQNHTTSTTVEDSVIPNEDKISSTGNKPRLEVTKEAIPYTTTIQNDATLPKGETKILQKGVDGERTIFTEIRIENGKEVKVIVDSIITKEAVPEVVANGTKEETTVPNVETRVTPEDGDSSPTVNKPTLEVTVEPIPHGKIVQNDVTLPKGETKVLQQGINGERTVFTEVRENNGLEERKMIESTISKPAVDEIVAVGTKENTVVEAVVEEKETVDVDFTTEITEDSSKYTDDVTILQEGEKGQSILTKHYKTVNGIKVGEPIHITEEVIKQAKPKKIIQGTKAIDGTTSEEIFESIPFKEIVEEDATLPKGTMTVSKNGKEGRKKITKTFKTVKGEKTSEAPSVEETIIEPAENKIIKKGTKELEKPVLSIRSLQKNDLKRTVEVDYSLTKPEGVTIRSITLTLKKEGKVEKEVTLSENELHSVLEGLDYYKDYTLSTSMTFDRGNGTETQLLEDQTVRLELKKIEIKDVREVRLIRYENQEEHNETRLSSVPTDTSHYYLKITSENHKTTLLAVKTIEEIASNGKEVYKVTAMAENLVDRQKNQTFDDVYTYFIEKPRTHVGNVYYDFEDLVNAIRENPTGEFRLGQSMSARNVASQGKSYIKAEFTGKLLSEDGKRFAIKDLEHPLFNVIKNATIKNVNFENVDMDLKNQDDIATVAQTMNGTSVIEDVKVTGSISGRNNVAGIVNYMNEGTRIENVAFIGKLHSTSGNTSNLGGIADKNYRAIVRRAYVDATLTGNKVRASLLVPYVEYGMIGDYLTGTKGSLTQSVAKGIIRVREPIQSAAFASKTWPFGTVKDNVSYAKVINGEMLFGSDDMTNEYSHPHINQLYSVQGYSEGKKTYNQYPGKQIELTKEAADARVASYKITADTFVSEESHIDALNRLVSKENPYTAIQDYKESHKQAYKNLEKIQPFYNKEFIINQANRLEENHAFNQKEILSVTAMNQTNFVTDLSQADRILVHYADKTKEFYTLRESTEGISNVKEYDIVGLGIKYTPNIVDKNHSSLIHDIVEKLTSVELQSNDVYQYLEKRQKPQDNTIEKKREYVKDLYLEESFAHVKENLTTFVTKLVQNEDHQLNESSAAKQMILDKVEKNKAALMLGMAYLHRYYGVHFDQLNIKELMLFKPDFYGINSDVLERLIEIGSKESTLKGNRTFDAFGEALAKHTLARNLDEFLNYNRQLLTEFKNMNDWFIDATKEKVYIVERASKMEGLKYVKYRIFDNLSVPVHRRMILPLLNVEKAKMFLISNYNTLTIGSADKYRKTIEEMKADINLVADRQLNYLDFWYRLAIDKVKGRLAKDTVTPIWEGYNVHGQGWPDKYGRYGQPNVYAPIREFYGPVGDYYGNNGGYAGAYAYIYANPHPTEKVVFVMSDSISDYGVSAYTHETTHINDRVVYLGGYRHREGTGVEAFAQGMLQTAVPGGMGEYGALGLNMAFERPNNGDQWYNPNPNELHSRTEIDHYMKGYNDTLMLLDYLEGESVIKQNNQSLNNAWFKKVDRELRNAKQNQNDQYDKVRPLTQEEKEIQLRSVNDLVDHNFITNRDFDNRIFKPDDYDSAYVNVRMTAGIYGGNTSKGSPGGLLFKHNTFRMWGYFGYEEGFIGYASNKYKNDADKEKKPLSDEFIIQKISKGRFNNLEDWKKAYFDEVVQQAKKGLHSFELNGKTINSYEELQTLFEEAVQKDLRSLKNGSVNPQNVVELKAKVFKQLLKATNSFKEEVFKK